PHGPARVYQQRPACEPLSCSRHILLICDSDSGVGFSKFFARPVDEGRRLATSRYMCGRAIKPVRPPSGTKELLRLNPPDHVTCDGSDEPSPHETSENV